MSQLYQLTLTTRYRDGGDKATHVFSKPSQEALSQLRRDLEQLKFPSPKVENVSFVSPGCMRAVWISQLHTNLHKQLKNLVYRTKSPGFSHFWGATQPSVLEIDWITLQETPCDPSQRQYEQDVDQWSSISDSSTVNKRAYPVERVAPGDNVIFYKPLEAPQPRSFLQAGQGGNRSRSRSQGRNNRSQNASPTKRIKLDHVNASRPVTINLNMSPTGEFQGTPIPQIRTELVAEPFATGSNRVIPLRARTVDSIASSREGSFRPEVPWGVQEPGRVQGSERGARGQMNATQGGTIPEQLEKQLSELRQHLTMDVKEESSLIGQLRQLDSSRVHEPSQSLIEKLRALTERVKVVEEDLVNERRRRLAAEEQLKGALAKETHLATTLKVAQRRWSEVSEELTSERERKVKLETELGRERRKRFDAEAVLKDVERECRTPFVVPALLEAFSAVSKLTTLAMDMDGKR
ncbi:hypothetical protein AX17_002194 [Amanita inopinata Kibby_2008]|nr:hypothetical protein AX17_002194 [Amanita inopinata Kibby_2008]